MAYAPEAAQAFMMRRDRRAARQGPRIPAGHGTRRLRVVLPGPSAPAVPGTGGGDAGRPCGRGADAGLVREGVGALGASETDGGPRRLSLPDRVERMVPDPSPSGPRSAAGGRPS